MNYLFGFEKLNVWKDSIDLLEEIYKISSKFPQEERYGLTQQIRRAAVSVSSNIAEGTARSSFKEQTRFTEIAFSSLMELFNQLIIALRLGYIDQRILDEQKEVIAKISNFLNALRKHQLSQASEPEIDYSSIDPTNPDSTIQQLNDSTTHSPSEILDSTTHHPTAALDPGAIVGKGSKIWHYSHVMEGAVIGEGCNLGQNVFVAKGVVLGNNVKVQNNVSIYEGVICEDDVFLGPSMVFTNVINPRSAVNRKSEYLPTHVGRGVTIGANATIVCGITLGEYAFVGAGAVVTKDVPAFALIVGNPARQIGWMSQTGERLYFEADRYAFCAVEDQWYTKDGDGTVSLGKRQVE